ncbi:peptidase U62 [Granulicella sp. WH15]|nr:peptidase U62 [Granulicella sp. WH15]
MHYFLLHTALGLAFATNSVACFAVDTPAPAVLAAAESAAAQDKMLQAMLAELERENSGLVLEGMQRPYFIEYRLDDIASYEAVANYGALTREEQGHQRVVRVTVRVGDYSADSSSLRGDGAIQLAPEDNDPAALRYALWTATDDAYKAALRAYAAKQADLKRFEKVQPEKDFAPAAPSIHIGPLVKMELDREEWKRRLIDASGAYLNDEQVSAAAADVQYSSSNLRAIVVNRYLVNTEGTVLRQGYSGYAANISVSGQATDGMRLGRDNGTVGVHASELESAAAFHQRAVDDVKSLEALRNAPVADAEDYHGPVLFSGDAAADVLDRLFVPNVEADRPDAGTTARTRGAYTSSYKSRVLPEILNVVDDPLQTTFNGKALLGSYSFDDEGVAAQKVEVATKGKLENYLIGRTPVRDFPASNGHGRAALGQAAHSRAGVLLFTATTPTPAAEMHSKLLAMAKEQGRPVYEVETMGGEATPRLLYRVQPDGKRELIRGAVFDELDNRSLRSDIVAAGDDSYISNTLGTVPQTTIAPSLLFSDIGVKRASEEQQKLPYYAPPTPEK